MPRLSGGGLGGVGTFVAAVLATILLIGGGLAPEVPPRLLCGSPWTTSSFQFTKNARFCKSFAPTLKLAVGPATRNSGASPDTLPSRTLQWFRTIFKHRKDMLTEPAAYLYSSSKPTVWRGNQRLWLVFTNGDRVCETSLRDHPSAHLSEESSESEHSTACIPRWQDICQAISTPAESKVGGASHRKCFQKYRSQPTGWLGPCRGTAGGHREL
ncbi:hypothetical protein B0H13DRAFT_1915797 [Mycena leptocephala]|nr:hypothetical protein B0H13DRAFT_1915797 [Mycena leptocephala]